GLNITRKDIYRVALLYELGAITTSQLKWQIEELNALNKFQTDVPSQIRNQILGDDVTEETHVIQSLWESILSKLKLEQSILHPENMLDLSRDQAEVWLEKIRSNNPSSNIHQKVRQAANNKLDEMLNEIGDTITLRGFVMALSGIDILVSIRPQLIRICASVMDEGVAAWQLPNRSEFGLYLAWRSTVQYDANSFLHDLPGWQQIITEIPEDAIDCIIMQLTKLEIPEEKWEGYLRRLALELPGWSGLINWRQHHPGYHTENNADLHLADYLAIRLTLDRLWLNQACQENWKIEAKLGTLQYYFRKNLSEFMVRKQLYQGELPEYLTYLAKDLLLRAGSERHKQSEWQELADLMWTWQFSPMAENNNDHSVFNSGWRLFRLCQHLGLNAKQIQG
ncbi:MAG: putative inorganic carbon transporter subunit DabA, partial [Pseudomonadota bacterium]